MGKIIILPETTKNPITLIGERAGICWGADITDAEKNYKRGLDCLESNHGRTLEYVNVETVIEGYSAKVIREYYTHIGGSPTRLQASTRYIDYTVGDGFEYVIPKSFTKCPLAQVQYESIMKQINDAIYEFEKVYGIPREDASMLLPIAMTTKIVDKRNLRNLIDMAGNRMCTRAYWEYRELFNDLCKELKKISDEWAYIVDNYMLPKCEKLGYCPERYSCGRKPKKDNGV